MKHKPQAFYTKIAPNLFGEMILEKSLSKSYKNAGGVLFGEFVVLENAAYHTRERESMPFASSKKLLPTPIASDAFALKKFSLTTQMKSHKNHQKRLYPYCADIWSERSGEIIDLIVEIYEEMMDFPPSWSKSTP